MTSYGKLIGIDCLEFDRVFAASPERLWEYLVDPDLRQTWFCAGHTDRFVGGKLVFDFDHDRISETPAPEIDGCDSKAQFEGEILEYDPPRRLAFSWPEAPGGKATRVAITLEHVGEEQTRMRLVHQGLLSKEYRDGAAAGWHAHLDLLEDIAAGKPRRDFRNLHRQREVEYADRLPA